MNLKSFFSRSRLALVAALAVLALPVRADLTLDSTLTVTTDGHVYATFLGSSASYSDNLFLQSPGGPSGVLFNNHTTPFGTTIDLGYFTAGTELVFGLYVNNTGNTFFTGDPSRNSDGISHAGILTTLPGIGLIVGFEDLLGGGDRDYNDLIFGFKNLGVSVSGPGGGRVPDAASTLSLFGLTLLGISAARRRFRQ
jgi:hypothetical protein